MHEAIHPTHHYNKIDGHHVQSQSVSLPDMSGNETDHFQCTLSLLLPPTCALL